MNRIRLLNGVTHGDCIEVMRRMRWASVDFILTDPPYLVNYRDRSGRSIANDNDDTWLKPAFRQMHRVLRPDSLCVSFYGWNRTDAFMTAWREAGFQIVGHIVFRKRYASKSRFLSYEHESAYLLAKGRPQLPAEPVPDVLEFPYSGSRLHPTQKPVEPLKTLIRSFTRPGQVVLDPFCGSGSTLAAAQELERRFIGIDIDAAHCRTARRRLMIAEGCLAAAA
jgi:site-specific DNA-methyltransferase (adenine-specific)